MRYDVLVTGASGFAGWHLTRALEQRSRVVASVLDHVVTFDRAVAVTLDLTDHAQVASLVRDTSPRVVVHTAACSKTGVCERDPDLARRVNDLGTRNLVDALERYAPAAHLVHFSTDLVYAGTRAFSTEESPVGPVMEYGRSKLGAEGWVRLRRGPWTVLRMALLYGPPTPVTTGANGWIVEALAADRPVKLFEDEFRSPVHVSDVVATVERAIETPGGLGVLNCGGSDRISRWVMGREVAVAYGHRVVRVGRARLATTALEAPRPPDVSLDVHRLEGVLGRRPLAFREGVRRDAAAGPAPPVA